MNAPSLKQEGFMNYFNLVFINHGDSDKNYLFKAALQVNLQAGEKVFVDTISGRYPATCVSDSFIVDGYTAQQIIVGSGAYLPLKHVVGRAKEKYECEEFISPEGEDIPF
ncbi:hypothetical protein DSECCO2_422710 [anaerobic digester metagenome]